MFHSVYFIRNPDADYRVYAGVAGDYDRRVDAVADFAAFSTKIAPSMFKTQMVALNFLALSIGFTLGGVLFKDYYNAESPLDFYWMLATIGAVTCGILLVLAPVLNRMLKGVD